MISRRPLNQAQHAELERIRSKHRGQLRPEHVLSEAESESSPLHSRFCWDDTEAARRFRMMEAQVIIRLAVIVLQGEGGKDIEVRAYTSLDEDRGKLGYRATVDVLGDKALRALMLGTALRELAALEQKHRHLSELAAVWKEADKVRSRKK